MNKNRHITNFWSKHITEGGIDVKLSPDVGNNPANLHMQTNEIIDVHKISYNNEKWHRLFNI